MLHTVRWVIQCMTMCIGVLMHKLLAIPYEIRTLARSVWWCFEAAVVPQWQPILCVVWSCCLLASTVDCRDLTISMSRASQLTKLATVCTLTSGTEEKKGLFAWQTDDRGAWICCIEQGCHEWNGIEIEISFGWCMEQHWNVVVSFLCIKFHKVFVVVLHQMW